MIVKGIIFAFSLIAVCSGAKHEKITLTDVQVLTLHRNAYTTGRRAPAVLQLKCVGGSAAKSAYHPAVVQCYNRGFDGQDVQWECKADLDNAVRFGKINVYCEGYNYPDDPFILKGSCGLEYHLEYTEKEKAYKVDDHETGGGFVAILIIFVFIGVIYFFCIRSDPGRRDAGPDRFRASGGGGGPPFDGPPPPYDDHGPSSAPPPGGDAPPPYGFRPEHSSGKQQQQQQGAGYSGYSSAGGQQRTYNADYGRAQAGAGAGFGTAPPPQGGGGPGFWTGLGAGGLMGYLFGQNQGGSQRSTYTSYRSPYTAPRSRNDDSTGSGWFGSGNGGAGSSSGGSSWFGAGASSGGSTGGSSGMGTRSASGFGETRRR